MRSRVSYDWIVAERVGAAGNFCLRLHWGEDSWRKETQLPDCSGGGLAHQEDGEE